MDHYAEVNKAYLEFFTSDPKPVSYILASKVDIVLIMTLRAEHASLLLSFPLRALMWRWKLSLLFLRSLASFDNRRFAYLTN
jgi:hypothetical protein